MHVKGFALTGNMNGYFILDACIYYNKVWIVAGNSTQCDKLSLDELFHYKLINICANNENI